MDLDIDPFTLPGMHEHMIRSPPPTTWPKSPNYKVFQFPNGEDETLQVEVNNVWGKQLICFSRKWTQYFQTKEKKSDSKPKFTNWDTSDISPLRSISRPLVQDRFSLLTPMRGSAEDSVHLMSGDDWSRSCVSFPHSIECICDTKESSQRALFQLSCYFSVLKGICLGD